MSIRDSWETPTDLFNELTKEFNFLVDACANESNKKCEFILDNALDCWLDQMFKIFQSNSKWGSGFTAHDCLYLPTDSSVFMNPPYSNAAPFLRRAWEFSVHMTVVCLVPSRMIHNKNLDFLFEDGIYRKCKLGLELRFLSARTHFIPPPGVQASSPSFGCMLLIMNRGALDEQI